MEEEEKTWTIKNIVKGKPIPFILLTLIFTKAFNVAANYGLNYYVNLNNDHPLYTYNLSLGKFGLILAIPAALLSVMIIKLFIKSKKTPTASSTLPVKGEIGNHMPIKSHREEAGVYSENGNKSYPQWKKVLIGGGRIVLKVWLKVLVISFKAIYSIVNGMSKNIGNSVEGTMTRWISGVSSTLDTDYNRQDVKSAANWNARQSQREANHAWNHAADQARYNVNTHHFDEKVNRAQRMQREADEARRQEQRL